MKITEKEIELARNLPGFKELTAFIGAHKIERIWTSTDTGSMIKMRLSHGTSKRELKFNVREIANLDLTESSSFGIPSGFFASTAFPNALMDEYRKRANFYCSEMGIIAAMYAEPGGIKPVLDAAVAFIRSGDPLKKEQKHNSAAAMKEARKQLKVALANGVTREEVIYMLDEIIVGRIMAS